MIHLQSECGRTVVMALLSLAAMAPAAHAQQAPRWQVEASLDATGPNSYTSIIGDGPGGGFTFKQSEAVRYTVGAGRLVRVAPRTSLRLGLSLSNKGFTEKTETATGTTVNHVDLLYLGAPLTLGYNLVNGSRGLRPFAEAGIVPELLLREDESVQGLDLLDTGLSYLVSVGVKYNLGNGRALVLAPEIRRGKRGYTRDTPGMVHFEPETWAIKLGVQF
jgi:hypothetical protein